MTLNTTKEKTERQVVQALRIFSRATEQLLETPPSDNAPSALDQLDWKIRELHITTNYLRKILSNMSQGLLFINLSGIIVTCNAAAARFLSIDPLDALFQPYSRVFDDQVFGFSISETIRQRLSPPPPCQILHTTADDKAIQLEIDAHLSLHPSESLSPLRDPSLDFSEGLLILIRDITDIARLKRQAERNGRMKLLGEMAAVVAHEIRNPLAGIKGFASLLARDLSDRPEKAKMAQSIAEAVDGMNRIVTNILNYARPLELCYRPIQLPELIDQLIASLRTDPIAEKISFESSHTPASYEIEVDLHLIRSALLNLLINALQAIDGCGTIRLTSYFDGKGCILTIEDTGSGMNEKQLEKLFMPLFTTKPEGSGLGLAEVLKIVQAHDGTIHADSVLGEGSRFILHLPNHGPKVHPSQLERT